MHPPASESIAGVASWLLGAGVSLIAFMAAACGGDEPASTPGLSGDATVAPAPSAAATATTTVTLVKVAGGFTRPTFVTNAGDGSGRLFVVEKRGVIHVVSGGQVDAQPFLDLTPLVGSSGNEQGLLGLAFHPDFEHNGRFFVYYTAAVDGANTLAEYRGNVQGGRGDSTSGRVVLAVPDKFSNHNGGMLAFGPDGYLYIGTGDGGSAGDPDGNGQDLATLLAKLLRIDVDRGSPYGIPSTNPFVGEAGARGETWAYGLRNPWRFSFDRGTGDLWIGDVGQNAFEEIDLQPAGSKGGENYGWSRMEGAHCYDPESDCEGPELVPPLYEYGHARGCSVTGGYVYRGQLSPGLVGTYLFADYCRTALLGLRPDGLGGWSMEELAQTVGSVSSFGEDEAGEVYFVSDKDGGVYRVDAR